MYKIFVIFVMFIFLTACAQNGDDIDTNSKASQSPQSELDSQVDSKPQSGEAEATEEPLQEEGASVLKTAVFEPGEHSTSGTLEILSDNTVKISNFSYDGLAPDVYIALGTLSDNGEFVFEVVLTEIIVGDYNDEDVILNFAEDIDISQYSAASIWCLQYSEDFNSSEFS